MQMRNNLILNKKNLYCTILAVGMIVFDQITKWLILGSVINPDKTRSLNEFFSFTAADILNAFEKAGVYALTPFLNLVLVLNRGISFGMFNGGKFSLFFALSSLVISLGLAIWMIRAKDKPTSFALALVIGGALGNVIDRIRFGAVIDFIDFYVGSYHWPAFNIADSCIAIGAFVMLFITLKNSEEDKNEKA